MLCNFLVRTLQHFFKKSRFCFALHENIKKHALTYLWQFWFFFLFAAPIAQNRPKLKIHIRNLAQDTSVYYSGFRSRRSLWWQHGRKPFHNLLHLTTDEKTDRKLIFTVTAVKKFPIFSMPHIVEREKKGKLQRPLSQWAGTFTDLNSISK